MSTISGIIIPARMESKRFPGKPLALMPDGEPLIWQACKAARASEVAKFWCIVTDSPEIRSWARRKAREIGEEIPCFYKSFDDSPPTGTDRIARSLPFLSEELSPAYRIPEADIYINLQCDEPDITGEDLDGLISAMLRPGVQVVTLVYSNPHKNFGRPDRNTVKVAIDASKVPDELPRAMYFSRAPMAGTHFHVGVYGILHGALMKFAFLPQGELEKAEKLEQLRFLENGIPIHVVYLQRPVAGINTKEDIEGYVHL